MDVRYHFSGIAGAGMNPLAQLMRARGHAVQGSDRSFDQGKNRDVAARLTALGIVVQPAGRLRGEPRTSTASSTPPRWRPTRRRCARRARYGIERVPRPALLAEVVDAGRPGVAIAGTSGKSTITGMVGWLTAGGGPDRAPCWAAPRSPARAEPAASCPARPTARWPRRPASPTAR